MIIVTYDFANDKVRTKFSKFLEKFGSRVQYSVFHIRNSQRVLACVLSEINQKYSKKISNTDHVLVFQVCEQCAKKIHRFGSATHEEEDVVSLGS